MSIAPIDYSAFQRSPVGIEAVLARGGSALSSILRDAMQVGRDRANRQASQEKDFLAERGRIDNLNQRRGEVALNAMQEDRRFGEGVRQFDTRMSEDSRRFEATSARADAELGLREQAGQRDQLRLDSQIEEDKFSREYVRPKELEIRENEVAASRERTAALAEDRAFRRQSADTEVIDRARGSALIDTYNQAQKNGDVKTAQEVARSLRDPRFGVPASTLDDMATETGLAPERSSSRKTEEVPIAELSDEELEDQLYVLTEGPKRTKEGGYGTPSEGVATRQVELEQERERRKKKGVYKPGGTGTSRAPAGTLQSLLEKGTGAY